MITVTIHRKTLVRLQACRYGLFLFDRIAALQPESDPRRLKRIKVRHWTPLHSLWAIVAGYAGFVAWAEYRHLVPRANLSGADLSGADLYGADRYGADLSGAYRGTSPAIPGWRTLETGYLEREA